MLKVNYEKNCVGCEYCINCGRNIPEPYIESLVCDVCKEEVEEVYEDECGDQVCISCLTKGMKLINDDTLVEYISEKGGVY